MQKCLFVFAVVMVGQVLSTTPLLHPRFPLCDQKIIDTIKNRDDAPNTTALNQVVLKIIFIT